MEEKKLNTVLDKSEMDVTSKDEHGDVSLDNKEMPIRSPKEGEDGRRQKNRHLVVSLQKQKKPKCMN